MLCPWSRGAVGEDEPCKAIRGASDEFPNVTPLIALLDAVQTQETFVEVGQTRAARGNR